MLFFKTSHQAKENKERKLPSRMIHPISPQPYRRNSGQNQSKMVLELRPADDDSVEDDDERVAFVASASPMHQHGLPSIVASTIACCFPSYAKTRRQQDGILSAAARCSKCQSSQHQYCFQSSSLLRPHLRRSIFSIIAIVAFALAVNLTFVVSGDGSKNNKVGNLQVQAKKPGKKGKPASKSSSAMSNHAKAASSSSIDAKLPNPETKSLFGFSSFLAKTQKRTEDNKLIQNNKNAEQTSSSWSTVTHSQTGKNISADFNINNKPINRKNFGKIALTPYKYRPGPPPPRNNVSAHFVQRWCDLRAHGKTIDWYPTRPTKNQKEDLLWQRRAPAFLIPGAKFCGTAELVSLLKLHPQIAPPRGDADVKFFLDFNFKRYVTAKGEITKVYRARQRLYAHHHMYPTTLLQADPNRISFDATPGYLLYSAVTPRRIFCVAPWVKLVILLQDPIDRLIQHYWHAVREKNLPLSFEAWVGKDLKLIHQVALTNRTPGSSEEDVAWYEYTSLTLEGAIGRSLYEIQLRQWFQAILAIGKRPKSVVFLMKASDFVREPQSLYQQLLHFLGLNETAVTLPPDVQLTLDTIPKALQSEKEKAMSPEFRKKLVDFYRPYQQRLPKTLEHFGVVYARPPKSVASTDGKVNAKVGKPFKGR